MKRILFPLVVLTYFMFVSSPLFAQEKKPTILRINQSPIIKALDSGIFFVDRLSLVDIGKEFQFQFTITNKSKEASPGVKFVISGYSKSGKLMARTTWVMPDEIPSNSKLLSLINLSPILRGASSYTATFSPESVARVPEDAEDCTTCSNNAITACGVNGVSSVDCSATPYKCSFSCKGELIIE